MTTEKLNKILEALDGISYLDWVKLERAVNEKFSASIHSMSNGIPLSDTDEIFKEIARTTSSLRQSE